MFSSAVKSGKRNFQNAISSFPKKSSFFLNFSEVKAQNKELTKKNQELEDEINSYSDLKNENRGGLKTGWANTFTNATINTTASP